MKILAYDTSSDILTAALFESEHKIAEYASPSFTRHSSTLVPALQKMLSGGGFSLDEVDVLVVGLGPGSFTGLRVGITTAKIFGTVCKMKIIGVSSLEAIAWEASDFQGDIAVILDARKEKLYAGIFNFKKGILRTVQKPKIVKIEALLKGIKTPRLFLGDGVKIYRDKILNTKYCQAADHAESLYPSVSQLIKQSAELIKKKKFLDPLSLEPLYLYPKDCNVTVRKGKS